MNEWIDMRAYMRLCNKGLPHTEPIQRVSNMIAELLLSSKLRGVSRRRLLKTGFGQGVVEIVRVSAEASKDPMVPKTRQRQAKHYMHGQGIREKC